jgi:hypothetical protein
MHRESTVIAIQCLYRSAASELFNMRKLTAVSGTWSRHRQVTYMWKQVIGAHEARQLILGFQKARVRRLPPESCADCVGTMKSMRTALR